MIINPKVKSKLYHLYFTDGVSLDIWAKDKAQVMLYLSELGQQTLESIFEPDDNIKGKLVLYDDGTGDLILNK